MGYLICKNCGGYYKLQPGERPEDFAECQCGGELIYKEDITKTEYENKLPSVTSYASQYEDEKSLNTEKSFFSRMPKTLIVSFMALIAILFKLGILNYFLYYFMRLNSSNSSSTYLFIFLALTLVTMIIRKYFLK